MTRPLVNLIILCTLTVSIIGFCIVFGGYSSLSRSQGRIMKARLFLTEACEERLDIFNQLIELAGQTSIVLPETIKQTAVNAEKILQKVISHTPPVDSALIKEFETSQTMVSQELIKLLNQLETRPDLKGTQRLTSLKKELNTSQDALFVARKQYNNETRYFNARVQMFPGALIAKLFGLSNITYTGISNDTFLSGEKTFTSAAL